MPIAFSDNSTLTAFAIIVDINNFVKMVTSATNGATKGKFVAQFTRDTLSHAIQSIEGHGGEVIAMMGDCVVGVVPQGNEICAVCEEIAGAVNRECQHISEHQLLCPEDWDYAPGGLSMKISIEFGCMSVTTICSHQLGTQQLIIGPALNYASRITQTGVGNRCVLGPIAAGMEEFSSRRLRGPSRVVGKAEGAEYLCYDLCMDDLWIEGSRGEDQLSYLV
jgi:class 3 adenylate cyclase